jgi:serpin B
MRSPRLAQLFPLLAAFFLLLSACGPTASIAKSGLQRNTSPNVQSDDFDALTDENNAFALDLYQSLRSRQGNLIYSPYSISLTLAMNYAGARGETEAQMAHTLHFLPQDKLHAALNALDLELAQRGKGGSEDATPLQLNIASAIWAEQTIPFLQTYLDVLAQNYGAGIQLADFLNQYEAVRKEINNWVSKETNDKIQDLLPENVLKPSTRMVLVNAIYFKADWRIPFDPNNTHDAPFHLLDGSEVQVKMMSESLSGVPYAQGDGYQAISLPYQGETASMVIIVPDEGRFEEFESTLDLQKLDEILGSMQPGGGLQLELPKFSFTTDLGLKEQLTSMGMPDAFDPDHADFSGMTGNSDLYIDNVLHKAFVAVDEKGTEAAAATGVVMDVTSIMLPDMTLTIDRPFFFMIRDLPSGQILFAGRVLNPAQ